MDRHVKTDTVPIPDRVGTRIANPVFNAVSVANRKVSELLREAKLESNAVLNIYTVPPRLSGNIEIRWEKVEMLIERKVESAPDTLVHGRESILTQPQGRNKK